ncbi:MAG: hypothetical protein UT13_C0001G0053 [Candidatus Pacebacteria bacterium GW2011_GWF2_38_9]|nr:MAG: hypothetical protein US01_C0001G0053 [candidate division TM6 bacterium GW2011_GWF2_28_16]KKQ08768.1 MAG: hypothetical protein US20_C0012G0010 [Candidatus Pacebacteria bacterium GW2011_GWF1_36_5]KKQ88407.1 MAG: hypothetical protein UT13_C0001G0053 [Candidatus Pacebacteria bacterium GW2011_GWF2_38_9]MBU1033349.1 hypothetical protein [Patescibacteria group bacterium]HAZ73024.1 hypothetical protein [Candidatus Paceibacterota bacterium]
MIENNFLKLLKDTAKEQSYLGQEKLIPDQLSDLANFVANHLWQTALFLAFLSTILLNFLATIRP